MTEARTVYISNDKDINNHTIDIPNDDLDFLGLKIGGTATFIFGTKEVICTISSSRKSGEWVFSKLAWDTLAIPFAMKITSIRGQDGKIHLGPIIGIFTAGFTGSPLRPVGERSFLFAKYIHAAKTRGGLAFIFGSHHIHWEEGLIEGYTFTDNGWVELKIPIPNVIYDRLPNRRTESHPDYSKVRERLQEEYEIPWFNPGFFDKWHIYQQLIDIPIANKYLPKTIASPTEGEIKDFVHQYGHVYIKPKNGSLGLGIHQVIYHEEEGFYYCRFRDQWRNRLRRYGSLSRLLRTQFPSGFDALVVQEGISLIKYQNNPIDFRVHTNKDINGFWKVSAIAAKVAGSGSVTTHVKSGGHVKSASEIWADLSLEKTLLHQLKESAITLSRAIDATTGGDVGEIGFDLGVDSESKIWMFEANSKPGRTIFSNPKLKHDDLLTRRLPMDYAFYLYRTTLEGVLDGQESVI
ncbi:MULTISPECIES: YheC/YheD family protein [Bacillaceae]|uniref:YheC/YheD family protein n=1 Tax=Evansella alkalicola TaxID=745819 RepID=A0ABS6JR51_9BACI|nr:MULTISPECIES: YheC/YheD family protein [Bacillaceae]MBU9720742.1 YheC/YheD family protein [Bacillus alkalicola]